MTYSAKKKKNGIGREHRGRKPKGWDKGMQEIVNQAVDEVSDVMRNETHQQIYNRHMLTAPDVRFNHPGLYDNRGDYTPADKIAAVVAFMVTGSSTKATMYCGVPSSTIRGWRKSEWWDALTQQVKKEKNDELDSMITGILMQSMDALVDRLNHGDGYYDSKTQQVVNTPVKARDIAYISSALFDKRALIRGDPTRRVEQVSTEARLGKLKEQFEKFSKAKEIEGEVVSDD